MFAGGRVGVLALAEQSDSVFFEQIEIRDESGPFTRGDANDDGIIDATDTATILNALAFGITNPLPSDRMDANDNEFVTWIDALYVRGYAFAGLAPPPAPFPLT